jgi:hypothetical protein
MGEGWTYTAVILGIVGAGKTGSSGQPRPTVQWRSKSMKLAYVASYVVVSESDKVAKSVTCLGENARELSVC